jgi:hypothetical protein
MATLDKIVGETEALDGVIVGRRIDGDAKEEGTIDCTVGFVDGKKSSGDGAQVGTEIGSNVDSNLSTVGKEVGLIEIIEIGRLVGS